MLVLPAKMLHYCSFKKKSGLKIIICYFTDRVEADKLLNEPYFTIVLLCYLCVYLGPQREDKTDRQRKYRRKLRQMSWFQV